MLGTLIKALEVDIRNADNNRYVRSSTYISQNLSRILSIRKHYPEFNTKGTMMFPKLTELGRLSKKEGLCLSYWHDCGDVSEFNATLGNKTELAERALLASRPAKHRNVSLSRYMQQSEDTILMTYLDDLSKATPGSDQSKRALGTQADRQQVTSLLYHLHVLEEQLHSMLVRRSAQLDFSPPTHATVHSAVRPVSLDNGPEQFPNASNQLSKPKRAPSFDTTGPIDIWYGLAENPKTPYRFLVWLSENHNPYVSQRALTTLKRQQVESRAAQAAYAS